IAEAEAVVAAFQHAGNPGVVAIGGKMYDRPHLSRAERILARAAKQRQRLIGPFEFSLRGINVRGIRTIWFSLGLLAFTATPVLAEAFANGDIKISQPSIRATPHGAKVAGGYMTISNTGSDADRLVGGSSGF